MTDLRITELDAATTIPSTALLPVVTGMPGSPKTEKVTVENFGKTFDDVGFNVIIGNGVSALTTGVKGFMEMPFKMEIEAIRLLADAAGACVIDIWKDTYANFPPTDADTITSSTPPTIPATNQKAEDTTLTTWTKTLAKGDILGFNVDSAVTIKQVTLSITGKRLIV